MKSVQSISDDFRRNPGQLGNGQYGEGSSKKNNDPNYVLKLFQKLLRITLALRDIELVQYW
jgi:hypothetical protein